MITGEIVGYEKVDGGKAICVLTEYRDLSITDGDNLIQTGKPCYSIEVDLDIDALMAKAKKDVEDHANALMRRTFGKNGNIAIVDGGLLKELIGYKAVVSQAEIKVLVGKDAEGVNLFTSVLVDQTGIKQDMLKDTAAMDVTAKI